jgi:DnaJ-class molecular chaperone
VKKRKIDDLYKELGVKKTATKAELKKAYRDRSKKTHPDKGGNPADFLAVKDAYEILTDDVKKLRYEQGDDPEQSTDSEVAGILAAALDAHILDIAEGKPVIGKIRKILKKKYPRSLRQFTRKKEK